MSGKQNTVLWYIFVTALPEVQMKPCNKSHYKYRPDVLHRLIHIFFFKYKIHYDGDKGNVITHRQHFIVYTVDD